MQVLWMMVFKKSIGLLSGDLFPSGIVFDIAQKAQCFALFRPLCYNSKNQAFGGFNKILGENNFLAPKCLRKMLTNISVNLMRLKWFFLMI